MLLVKRSFKSLGKVYTAGSEITEPACIKRLKGKIAEGKVIEVTEQTYDSTAKYFKEKYGVVIPQLKKPTEEPAVETTNKPAVETPVVKASVITSK